MRAVAQVNAVLLPLIAQRGTARRRHTEGSIVACRHGLTRGLRDDLRRAAGRRTLPTASGSKDGRYFGRVQRPVVNRGFINNSLEGEPCGVPLRPAGSKAGAQVVVVTGSVTQLCHGSAADDRSVQIHGFGSSIIRHRHMMEGAVVDRPRADNLTE